MGPSATLLSQSHFPAVTGYRACLLQAFLLGTSRASPVAWYVLVTMLSLSPRWNRTNDASLVYLYCLHLQIAGSTSRVYSITRPPMRLLTLRPGNLLITLKVTLSIDFRDLVTLLSAIQATGLLASTLTGLTPAEHTSLSWTHNLVRFLKA